MIIKIDWVNLIRDHGWCGWIYYGSERDGNPFRRDNLIYWQYYKHDWIRIRRNIINWNPILRRYMKDDG